jgi:hypothetical protein
MSRNHVVGPGKFKYTLSGSPSSMSVLILFICLYLLFPRSFSCYAVIKEPRGHSMGTIATCSISSSRTHYCHGYMSLFMSSFKELCPLLSRTVRFRYLVFIVVGTVFTRYSCRVSPCSVHLVENERTHPFHLFIFA